MARRGIPEVNAGSMADIAFLLLIFFLVTTKIGKDEGIYRMLPRYEENPPPPPKVAERDILSVLINKDNQLMVNGELSELKDLTQMAIDHIDNNGNGTCTYCKGKKSETSSLHPTKAIIALSSDGKTSYDAYLEVQDRIMQAYYFLRNRECRRIYKDEFGYYDDFLRDSANDKDPSRDKIKERYNKIRDLYPMNFSDSETEKTF